MSEYKEHTEAILNEVEALLLADEEPADLGNISVGSWVSEKDQKFHVTLARMNNRTGHEKRIAIPYDQVPTVIANMMDTLIFFRVAVEKAKIQTNIR